MAPPASTSLNCAREKVGVNEQSSYWFSWSIQWQRWCIGDIVKYLGVLCNVLVNLVPFAGRYQESLGYRFYWIRVMKILEAGSLMTSLYKRFPGYHVICALGIYVIYDRILLMIVFCGLKN